MAAGLGALFWLQPAATGCGAGSTGSLSDLCFSPLQNEMVNRQIQKEIWRIQDVMEGLRKNNPSRGTDTAKHRGEQARSLPCMAQPPACHSLGHPPGQALTWRGCAVVHVLISAFFSLFFFSLQWPSAPRARTAPTAPPAP